MRTTCVHGGAVRWESGEPQSPQQKMHFWQPAMGAPRQDPDRHSQRQWQPSCTRPHLTRRLSRRVNALAKALDVTPEGVIAAGLDLVERQQQQAGGPSRSGRHARHEPEIS